MLISLFYTLVLSIVICFIFVFAVIKLFVKTDTTNRNIYKYVIIFSVFNGILLNASIIYYAPNVCVINSDKTHDKRYYIGLQENLKVDGKYVYNNTGGVLLLKEFIYGNKKSSERTITIQKNSYTEVEEFPEYYFEQPPKVITVSRYSGSVRWGVYYR